jgi:hypothetical protein
MQMPWPNSRPRPNSRPVSQGRTGQLLPRTDAQAKDAKRISVYLAKLARLLVEAKAERDKLLLERDALAKDLETAKTQCDDIQASLKTKRQQLRRQAHRLLGQLVLSLLGYPPHASLPADIHKEKEILQKTKLVDSTWYLKMYKDVAKANMNPVLHYLRYGIKEGRIPSPIFAFDEVYTEEKLRALMVVQDSALAQLKT